MIFKGTKNRRFHAPPMGGKHVTIVLDVPRVECRDYGMLRQVNITFAKPMRRHIRAFERYTEQPTKYVPRQLYGDTLTCWMTQSRVMWPGPCGGRLP